MKKAIIGILVLAVILAVSFIYAEVVLSQNNGQSPSPQPPIPAIIPSAQNVTGTAEGSQAASIALANDEVKQYTDKGYQFYGVFRSGNVYWVGILTNEQKLPWVTGISLIIPVQFNSSDPIFVNFELTLTNLTESQKEQTLQIASSTIKQYGGNATTEDVSVRSWSTSLGNTTMFHAYPCVSFRVPEDFHEAGTEVAVYVDLQKGKVAHVQTNPSKPNP